MDRQNKNKPRQIARVSPAAAKTTKVEPVSHELLFEAAEAWVSALSAIDPERLDDEAIGRALTSEALAPFDARETAEAYEFLRRLGYLE